MRSILGTWKRTTWVHVCKMRTGNTHDSRARSIRNELHSRHPPSMHEESEWRETRRIAPSCYPPYDPQRGFRTFVPPHRTWLHWKTTSYPRTWPFRTQRILARTDRRWTYCTTQSMQHRHVWDPVLFWVLVEWDGIVFTSFAYRVSVPRRRRSVLLVHHELLHKTHHKQHSKSKCQHTWQQRHHWLSHSFFFSIFLFCLFCSCLGQIKDTKETEFFGVFFFFFWILLLLILLCYWSDSSFFVFVWWWTPVIHYY